MAAGVTLWQGRSGARLGMARLRTRQDRVVATVLRGGLLVQHPGDGTVALASPTLVEQAYDHLLAMILTTAIAPGERVAIDRVARQLAMSQTPIREALSQLEAERLVFKRPNVGYRACPEMGGVELRDAFALRLLVEPHAAAEAARNMGKGARAGLSSTLREMDSAALDPQGKARFAEALAAMQRQCPAGRDDAVAPSAPAHSACPARA